MIAFDDGTRSRGVGIATIPFSACAGGQRAIVMATIQRSNV
jgi:hypothetical protein